MKTKDLFQDEPTVILLFKKLMENGQRVTFSRWCEGDIVDIYEDTVRSPTVSYFIITYRRKLRNSTPTDTSTIPDRAFSKMYLYKKGDDYVFADSIPQEGNDDL